MPEAGGASVRCEGRRRREACDVVGLAEELARHQRAHTADSEQLFRVKCAHGLFDLALQRGSFSINGVKSANRRESQAAANRICHSSAERQATSDDECTLARQGASVIAVARRHGE